MSTVEMFSSADEVDRSGEDRSPAGTRLTHPAPPMLTMVQAEMPADDPSMAGDALEGLIEAWVRRAYMHWRAQPIDDGVWVADVVGLDGAWAEGPSREVAVANLQSVLYDWVKLKLADGDRDIPPMDGLSLVVEG